MQNKTLLSALFITFSYLLCGQGFNMTLEGQWDNANYEFNDCWGYTDVSGNEYAIMGSRTRVIFFDVTDPAAPTFISEFTGAFPGINGANSIWRDFKTFDRYAYAVADQGNEGLMVFDMSDIHNGNVLKVNQLNNNFGQAHNIFIDVPKGKLYIIGSNTQNNGLIVYDIAEDPSNPVMLASVAVTGGYVHDAYVYDDIAYCSSGFDGLYIIDMSTPSSPTFKSFDKTTAAGYNHSGWPFNNGNEMLVAEEVPTGLKLGIYDISDLNDISHTSSFRDPVNTSGSGFPTYHNPFMVGDLAVISSYEDGVTIMDLSNTSAPFRAAHYDTYTNSNYSGTEGCWGAYPYFPSGTIIGSDIFTGLYILNTTLTMTNTCSNGIKDDFEIDVDCGGFCNTCVCSAPTDMVFTDISFSSLQIDWTTVSTAIGYEVRYREIGTSTWAIESTPTNMVTLNGLQLGTAYEFQIRADCNGRLTPYATRVTYTTGNCIGDIAYRGTQGTGEYSTANFLRSSAFISEGSNVSYFSGDSILLDQRFCVGLNTDLLVETGRPCGIPAIAGQAEISKYVNLEPAVPEEIFSIVEHPEANFFHIVINKDISSNYTIEFIDAENNILEQFNAAPSQKLKKFERISQLHSLRILVGDKDYRFVLNK